MNESLQRYQVVPKKVTKAISFDCPPDKSLTHRAIIFSSLADGVSYIENPLMGADCLATLKIFEHLGVKFSFSKNDEQKDVIKVESLGWQKFVPPAVRLDCENSGTTARLLTGMFAAIPHLVVELTGDDSLRNRPMGRLVAPLVEGGAKIEYLERQGFLPIRITGQKLNFSKPVFFDKPSAQLKSGMLLAACVAQSKLRLSLPSGARNHTEHMLTSLKCDLKCEQDNQGFEYIELNSFPTFKAKKYKISGDPSSAAFFAALAAIQSNLVVEIKNVLINSTRFGFFNVLKRMGVSIDLVYSKSDYIEPTASIKILRKDRLLPLVVKESEIPSLIDEIPILAVIASFAEGKSSFHGIEELRVKETDRLKMTELLLNNIGTIVQATHHDLVISGPVQSFSGFHYDPKFDHRMFMSAAILALFADSASEIADKSCVSVSFPSFFDLFDSLV